ncbi:HipA family kinase [Streptosporangium sp. NPDC051022]|uniref:HipA family kinase n=1 Tax=Streptosporangium sp. NPDC051022 TaxID=3155752 RepID=UPI003442A9C7
MLVELAEWKGLVKGRSDSFDDLSMIMLLETGRNSFASPFLAAASDGHRYWVKCIDTCPEHAKMSIAIEYIVSGVGRLIGAPVCESSLIRIPEEMAGWPLGPGQGKLQAGLAYASRALSNAIEHRPALESRTADDNRRRQVGIYALWDWCFGSDPQWLYDLENDKSIYSHDHGLYFPTNDGSWERKRLIQCVDEPNELDEAPHGLNREAVREVAAALEKVDRDALVQILRGVPTSWPVSDDDLEALGWFLEYRAPAVAGRVRALTGGEDEPR